MKSARRRDGMTMMELLAAVSILLTLIAALAVRTRGIMQRARVSSARAAISAIALALGGMRDDTGAYPARLEDLKSSGAPAHLNVPSRFWGGPYLPARFSLIDPWGNPYFYEFGTFDVFSDSTIDVTGSSQIHGFNWNSGEFTAEYAVASNEDIRTGPSPNCYITADTQTEHAGIDINPPQNPAGMEEMPFTAQGDPGVSGNCRIDAGGNFYMGLWPYRPSSTLETGTYKFNNFDLISNVELIVDGAVTLYIMERLYMPGTADIFLTEGSSLKIYLADPGGELDLRGDSAINAGGRPSAVKVFSASDKMINMSGNVRVNASIHAPLADLRIQGSSELWGSLWTGGLSVTGNSRVYADAGSGGSDHYRLGSFGRDGKPGGEGFDADIVYGEIR